MKGNARRKITRLAERFIPSSGNDGSGSEETVEMPSPSFWNVAGGFSHPAVVNELMNALRDYHVRSNILAETHDCLPGMRWNGGRMSLGMQREVAGVASVEQALESVRRFNDLGIGVFLTFSNHLLAEEHLEDERCNTLLQGISDNPLNGIVCAGDCLLGYVRRLYPKMKIKLSVIRSYVDEICNEDEAQLLDWHRAMLDRYDTLCLNPNLNKRFRLLEKLPLDRIEAVVSLPCDYRCPFAAAHYEACARANLYGPNDWSLIEQESGFCEREHRQAKRMISDTVELSVDSVRALKGVGVRHFLIHGRTDDYWKLTRRINAYMLNPLGIYLDMTMVHGEMVVERWDLGRHEFTEQRGLS